MFQRRSIRIVYAKYSFPGPENGTAARQIRKCVVWHCKFVLCKPAGET